MPIPARSSGERRPRQRNPRALERQDWIDAARRMLTAKGVERVRVDALARTLRITRGSFYWHFSSRKALLDALLADWCCLLYTSIAPVASTMRAALTIQYRSRAACFPPLSATRSMSTVTRSS